MVLCNPPKFLYLDRGTHAPIIICALYIVRPVQILKNCFTHLMLVWLFIPQLTLHKSQCVEIWLMDCGQIRGWFWLHINNSHNNAPPPSITSQLSTYHFSPSRCDSRSLVSPIIALLLRWVMVPAGLRKQWNFYFESIAISWEISSFIWNNVFWNHW